MSKERIVILGATSAIAEHYARLQAARGARLVLAGRNRARLDSIAADLRARGAKQADVAALDLSAADGLAPVWAQMTAQLGGTVDCMFLAYGELGDQDAAEKNAAETMRLMQVNLVSACGWLTLAAETMAGAGRGRIIAISSVAGDRGRRSNYVYGAAKAGLARFLEGLNHRFAASGVTVLDVRPGFVDTPMTAPLPKGGPLWAKPDKVAADIDRAARAGKPVVYTPWFWWPIMLIIRNLPRAVFNRMKI